EGIRWSDGEPFTADDVVFAVEDVCMDPDLSPVPPFGQMSAEKIDKYTVMITFAEPNGLFISDLATRRGNILTERARHYLEQFHKQYNSDVDQMAADEGLDTLMDLFAAKAGEWGFGYNPDVPTLYAWVLKERTESRTVVERNPYFWKVDPEGSQLPYID